MNRTALLAIGRAEMLRLGVARDDRDDERDEEYGRLLLLWWHVAVLPPSRSTPPARVRALRALWPAIVGREVANTTEPVALNGDALVVLTDEAAWSHQLAFLERAIIRGYAERGFPGIQRLRFRTLPPAATS